MFIKLKYLNTMNNYKRCNVVILSTNEKADLYLYQESTSENKPILQYHKDTIGSSDYKYQHLFVISDDEIKEGDWYYSNALDFVIQAFYFPLSCGDAKKIIASTDSSLKFGEDVPGIIKYKSLPQPSQSFIEEYIQRYNDGNPIEDVMVEYEDKIHYKTAVYRDNANDLNVYQINSNKLIPKINPDNTITIKGVKKSWTRDEVIELTKSAFITGSRVNDIDYFGWMNEHL